MDLSFSGAGFMGCYYFGVVDCWKKYVPCDRINRVAGASAGSLIAAYYLMDLPLVPCLRSIIDLTEDIRRRPLGVFDRSNQIVDILPKILDKLFPADAHKIVSGRLFVSMTRLKDMKNVLVSEFETRQELIDALNCSCFIPVWSGNHVSTYKGVKHIDGGFSDNLPVFDEHTIRICCFAGQSDISPYDSKKLGGRLSTSILNTPLYINMANMKRARRALFPPPVKFILEILERGFHDAKQFILNHDVIQCNECYNSLKPEEQSFAAIPMPLITPTGSPSAQKLEFGSFDFNNNSTTAVVDSKEAQEQQQQKQMQQIQDYLKENPISIVIDQPEEEEQQQLTKINNFSESCDQEQDELDQQQVQQPEALQRRNIKALKLNLSALNVYGVANNNGGEDDVIGEEEDAELALKYARGARRPTLPANVPSQKFLERRRNTVQSEGPLLPVPERFTSVGFQLPSCPPSPNLDRHCNECIRLRQAARVDHLEETIRATATQFLPGNNEQQEDGEKNPDQQQAGADKDASDKGQAQAKGKRKLTRSLTSPLRWIRQIGTKGQYSYTFEDFEQQQKQQRQQHPRIVCP